jgi:hypothetical protein
MPFIQKEFFMDAKVSSWRFGFTLSWVFITCFCPREFRCKVFFSFSASCFCSFVPLSRVDVKLFASPEVLMERNSAGRKRVKKTWIKMKPNLHMLASTSRQPLIWINNIGNLGRGGRRGGFLLSRCHFFHFYCFPRSVFCKSISQTTPSYKC